MTREEAFLWVNDISNSLKLLRNRVLTFPSLERTTEQIQRAKYPAYPRTSAIYNKCVPELLPWLQASGFLWINCSIVLGWTTAFTFDVMDINHAPKKFGGTKFLLVSHFCTEQEKQPHWIIIIFYFFLFYFYFFISFYSCFMSIYNPMGYDRPAPCFLYTCLA